MPSSVYIHVPFCVSRCPYCAFYSGEPLELLSRYPTRVAAEAALRARAEETTPGPLETIYFGGGTPSLLGASAVAQILEALDRAWGITLDAEVTLEVNPGDRLDLRGLRAAGFTRLSVGVQALDDEALRRLGRRHSATSALDAVSAAATAGFRASADLLFGHAALDRTALASWVKALRTAGAQHVSAYSLEVHPGTPLARDLDAGLFACPPPSEEEAQWDALDDALRAEGFEPYEVSNYCLPGAACRHNLAYWEGRHWVGLGPGAHGFAPSLGPRGTRSWNDPGLAAYAEAVDSGRLPPGAAEELTADAALLESLFLALRRPEPIDFRGLAQRHRARPQSLLARLREAVSSGLLTGGPQTLGFFVPTAAGMRAADGLALWLLGGFKPEDSET